MLTKVHVVNAKAIHVFLREMISHIVDIFVNVELQLGPVYNSTQVGYRVLR